jgi:hypothetical protein
VDVATRARTPRAAVGRIERGDLERVAVGTLRAVTQALQADLVVAVRWNGTELERLLGAGHSALHELVVSRLQELGWEVIPERSFSWYGERGIIDLVAWHVATRTLLVVELKTEIVDVQELIGTVDRYRRHAPKAVEDLGWVPAGVGVWVAVADTPTNRRRLAEHARLLRAAFPTDGRSVPAWLRTPAGPLRALSFLSDARVAHRIAARSSRLRVRTVREDGSGPPARPRFDHRSSQARR